MDPHPVLNMVVTESSNDFSDFFVIINVFGIKISVAGKFVGAHNIGGDITRQENRNF
jgi:hypothetical protein